MLHNHDTGGNCYHRVTLRPAELRRIELRPVDGRHIGQPNGRVFGTATVVPISTGVGNFGSLTDVGFPLVRPDSAENRLDSRVGRSYRGRRDVCHAGILAYAVPFVRRLEYRLMSDVVS